MANCLVWRHMQCIAGSSELNAYRKVDVIRAANVLSTPATRTPNHVHGLAVSVKYTDVGLPKRSSTKENHYRYNSELLKLKCLTDSDNVTYCCFAYPRTFPKGASIWISYPQEESVAHQQQPTQHSKSWRILITS